ncbi:hypothetical protein [Methylobacterium sp. ID0610]|uniref:hypothetical protein n=1 Tax=Methylobacterium carpenticola TaxID=3344827 RepID=UPI00368DBA18
MPAQFFFVIPFISAQIARDFRSACAKLRATLEACLSQSDMSDVKIAVCCHEIPPSFREDFPQIKFIDAPLGPPRVGATINEIRYDKASKLRRLAVHVHDSGGGHVMMLDADDLVSSKLVAQVRLHAPESSMLFNGGFVVSEPRRVALNMLEDLKLPLWEGCGSCLAAFFRKDDLPFAMVDFSPWKLFNQLQGHKSYKHDFRLAKRELTTTDEPMVIYVKDHGSNLTMIQSNGQEDNVFEHQAAREISKKIGDDFKIPEEWLRK